MMNLEKRRVVTEAMLISLPRGDSSSRRNHFLEEKLDLMLQPESLPGLAFPSTKTRDTNV